MTVSTEVTQADRFLLSHLHGELTQVVEDPPAGMHPDTLFCVGIALSQLERDCREVEAMA